MNKKTIATCIIVIAAITYYWVYQSSYQTTNPEPTPITDTQDQTQVPTTPAKDTPTSSEVPANTQNPTSTGNPTAPAPKTYSVTVQNFAFSLATVSIKKGDTITWTNKDSVNHTVTGNNGGPNSSLFGLNQTYSFTFNT